MYQQLLTTKLFVPPLRPGIVARPRLLQKMSAGMNTGARATIITAPAGYGKSTLALEWLKSLDRPHCWVSLDREDNHPVQFLAYLTAAVDQVAEDRGEAALPAHPQLEKGEAASWLQAHLPALINHIAAIRKPFLLVLDDYHLLTDLTIHQAVGFLIEHQPPQMHLVIATRQDPLLPLSKLRSRGWITEIRLGELRFTPEETARFLNETMRLNLTPKQVSALDSRTEGWIAGLQLAALSLSELPGWSNTVQEDERSGMDVPVFAGDDRHIVDYLTDEVLSRQPEEIQHFLLQTSILKHLCGPLCEAVITDQHSENRSTSSPSFDMPLTVPPGVAQSSASRAQLILEYLEHANLFIIPQDNRRQWYRYHHLFSDLLNNRLQAGFPELVSELHCRASKWYEDAKLIAEAVDHAILAEDFDRALRLIEHSASSSIWSSGDLPVLLNWSRRLPDNIFLTRPRLCLYYARGLFFAGQVDAAENHIQQAETALRTRKSQDPASEELWGILYTNQATIQAMKGEAEAALLLAEQAADKISPEDLSTRARISHAVGTAEFLRGNVRQAEEAFSAGAAMALQVHNHNLGLDLISNLAQTQIISGRLAAAASTCEEALSEPENRRAPAASTIYLALAQVQYERNELEAALSTLDISLELGRKLGWPHLHWQAYLLQAEVRRSSGGSGWEDSLRLAQDVVTRYPLSRPKSMLQACQARFEIARGNQEAVERWASEYRQQLKDNRLLDYENLTLARALFVMGFSAEALDSLEKLDRQAKPFGRIASLIEAHVLRALFLNAAGDKAGALESLAEAVALAQPEGYVRIFLAEGKEMHGLLSQLLKNRLPVPISSFTSRLLAAFEGRVSSEDHVTPFISESPGMVEPLTPREIEVLGLIAEGFSNPEIAARLFLSVNTLRAHTTNIYQKLAVHNRVQAASRARDLGLLPKE